jgi:hypothetical protein
MWTPDPANYMGVEGAQCGLQSAGAGAVSLSGLEPSPYTMRGPNWSATKHYAVWSAVSLGSSHTAMQLGPPAVNMTICLSIMVWMLVHCLDISIDVDHWQCYTFTPAKPAMQYVIKIYTIFYAHKKSQNRSEIEQYYPRPSWFVLMFQSTPRWPCRSKEASAAWVTTSNHKSFVAGTDAVHN